MEQFTQASSNDLPKSSKDITNAPHTYTVIEKIKQDELINSNHNLESITDDAWSDALKAAKQINAPQATKLMQGYKTTQQFMLLLSGTVRVYKPSKNGREITLYRVNPGDLCVLSLNSLYQNQDYGIAADAETDIYALGISAQSFRTVFNTSEKFRDFVLSTLNSRLCELMCLVQDTTFVNLDVRLANLLITLCNTQNSIHIEITHQDLARELGTTREMISRILKDFEQKNFIKLSRGYINILSHEGLLLLKAEM